MNLKSKIHTDTWNGETKVSHKQLFTLWYDELQKSKKYLQDLLDQGSLVLATITNEYNKKVKIITGKSMYRYKSDIQFINEYQEQINLLVPLSNIFLFIQQKVSPIDGEDFTGVRREVRKTLEKQGEVVTEE